ncbi:hypothetical protein MMAN_56510 [Mycobacterium mantenii]|uniref:SnoaL-like domain-containing protein n=1 Tax=Mycobacterium mantenii TaxID=560555 RepID=A0ABM7K1K4_MYCNT|nr:hypothetical protein MMAN_56510 [Mycobacterium mantenii]
MTMSQPTTAEAGADLIDRADVEVLLRRFYGRALDDEVLAEPFIAVLRCRIATSGADSACGTTPLTRCTAGRRPIGRRFRPAASRGPCRRLTGLDAPELLVTQPARDGQAPDRTGSGGR